MTILCRILGHSLKDWGIEIREPYFDGILRAHRGIVGECKRCGEKLPVGKTIDRLFSGERGLAFYNAACKEKA